MPVIINGSLGLGGNIEAGTIVPEDLSTGAPVWNTSGEVTVSGSTFATIFTKTTASSGSIQGITQILMQNENNNAWHSCSSHHRISLLGTYQILYCILLTVDDSLQILHRESSVLALCTSHYEVWFVSYLSLI